MCTFEHASLVVASRPAASMVCDPEQSHKINVLGMFFLAGFCRIFGDFWLDFPIQLGMIPAGRKPVFCCPPVLGIAESEPLILVKTAMSVF
ncbi:hypothetical protein NNA36_07320 [Shimia sp. CNT1-13L.2]|uniref:hypothetical protein n=1 Tax=Shimia sp. CNT1-13L.2 TaxID=2959663 RepID=UPI0020CDE6C7|nr:hypothetical protein [Shimia sp. CNT1-13L.2]MCP9481768.1 hypothetical protein [Shimia sp. CNT1-13L.2]